jgi:signal transduction histidine kinase
MSDPGQNEALNATLRGAATRAADIVGGGCSLVFAAMPGETPNLAGTQQLRAAAGFETPDVARAAAIDLLSQVREVVQNGESLQAAGQPSLGARGAAGLVILPLGIDDRTHGAILVAFPGAPPQPASGQLAQLASSVSIHLDHAHLKRQIHHLNTTLGETESDAEEKNDELLKLSEALFAQDIELLRNNEKLGKIEKLKNDFIEKMSRELRTPLNSIIEAIISVLTCDSEGISQETQDSLRGALDEGTSFQRTLQNILDLWRIKQGELPVEIQDVSFPELVDEAIFSVQDTLAGKPVEIETEFEGTLPVFRADLAKLNQILFLILDNAAKFTHEGVITIRGHLDGSTLSCEIQDNGIGICSDDQQFIFDEFYQVDEHWSTKYRGAGLGLTLVRDLLVLLEGEITISSDAGKGTLIGFQIPVQPV